MTLLTATVETTACWGWIFHHSDSYRSHRREEFHHLTFCDLRIIHHILIMPSLWSMHWACVARYMGWERSFSFSFSFFSFLFFFFLRKKGSRRTEQKRKSERERDSGICTLEDSERFCRTWSSGNTGPSRRRELERSYPLAMHALWQHFNLLCCQ